MTKLDRFSSIVLIAVVAAGAGWAASSFTSRQTNANIAQPLVAATPANNLINPEQIVTAPVLSASASVPATTAVNRHVVTAKTVAVEPAAAVVTPVVESAPVIRATRPRVVNPQANANSSDYRSTRYESKSEPRKRGMSKTMKNAIVIGGGAAMGAAIGGIAKGGKGAAIGAAVGGGAGALYTWMKHKQNQPVF
jgi:hypothetical protein